MPIGLTAPAPRCAGWPRLSWSPSRGDRMVWRTSKAPVSTPWQRGCGPDAHASAEAVVFIGADAGGGPSADSSCDHLDFFAARSRQVPVDPPQQPTNNRQIVQPRRSVQDSPASAQGDTVTEGVPDENQQDGQHLGHLASAPWTTKQPRMWSAAATTHCLLATTRRTAARRSTATGWTRSSLACPGTVESSTWAADRACPWPLP